MKFFRKILVILLVTATLFIQLGFSYWISGAVLGCFLLFTFFIFPNTKLSFLPRRHNELLFVSVTLLASRILYSSIQLRDIRIIFFIFILYIVANSSFSTFKLKSSGIDYIFPSTSILTIYGLLVSYFISLIPGSFLNSTNIILFQDKWLVQNKMFDTIESAVNASKYKYLGIYDRFPLLYGEPSYLAGVLCLCAYICIIAAYYYLKIGLPTRKSYSLLTLGSLNFSAICAIYLMIFSGSLFGVLCSLFLLILFYSLPHYHSKIRLIKLSILILIFGILFVTLLLSVSSDVLQLYLTRIFNIASGSDMSSSGRIYPIVVFFSNPLGLGINFESQLEKLGYPSADVGIVSQCIQNGIFFIMFLFAYLKSFYRKNIIVLSYLVYTLLIWSQSGSIFAVDKIFLSVFPLPFILLVSKNMLHSITPQSMSSHSKIPMSM